MLFLTSCKGGIESRSYLDDLTVELPDSDVTLIIKQWSWLNHNGVEIYYLDEKEKQVILGQTNGGKDGYYPFADGKYEIINNGDDTFTVKWFNSSIWQEVTFNIPQ